MQQFDVLALVRDGVDGHVVPPFVQCGEISTSVADQTPNRRREVGRRVSAIEHRDLVSALDCRERDGSTDER